MRAERENSEAVGERNGVDADSDDEAENAEDNGGAQDARSRSDAMHGCELGPRCPLFFMAVNRSSLHHTAASTGGDSRGVIKGKRTFNIWLMPAEDLACHPVLGSLSQEMAKFALTYLSKSLNIPPPRDQSGKPSVEELNRILLNHLVERRGQHVRVWCTRKRLVLRGAANQL